jgi:hypothetical protein
MTDNYSILTDVLVPHLVDTKQPAVEVFAHRAITELQLKQILLGIEEESIPYVVTWSDQLNPLELAHEAAVTSRLGVGVGVSLDYVVITTEKLPAAQPYVAHWLNYNHEVDRGLGATAARLVKRLPLTGPDGRSLIFAPPLPQSTYTY